MIIQHVRHGRTRRDAANLAHHLARLDDNEIVSVIETSGLATVGIASALEAMRRLASKPNAAAFHHISLSPSVDQTDDELRADARRVIEEMQAGDHAIMIVRHRKPSVAGRAENHVHLIVSHWSLAGKALDDGWLHLRLERLAREIEFDRGHKLTAGRHDAAIVKALRKRGRLDVAAALAVIQPDAPPRSAITSEKRQALKREGVSDVDLRVAVKAAWDASDDGKSLRAALAADGLDLREGRKPGVWIVFHDAIEIGALDRLLRLKRGEVSARVAIQVDEPPTPPAVDSEKLSEIKRQLDAIEQRARRLYGQSKREFIMPEGLRLEQDRVVTLRRNATTARLRQDEETAVNRRLHSQRPRGFWAWITGRTRRHREAYHRHQARLQRTIDSAERLAISCQRAEQRLNSRLDAWASKAKDMRHQQEIQRKAAASDLQSAADASRLLQNDEIRNTISDTQALIALATRKPIEGQRLLSFKKSPQNTGASRQPVPGAVPTLTLRPSWTKGPPWRAKEKTD